MRDLQAMRPFVDHIFVTAGRTGNLPQTWSPSVFGVTNHGRIRPSPLRRKSLLKVTPFETSQIMVLTAQHALTNGELPLGVARAGSRIFPYLDEKVGGHFSV